MFFDDLFVKAGGNFPYRRYQEGTISNFTKLRHLLLEYTPKYDEKGFDSSKLERKVFSAAQNGEQSVISFFEIGPKNIAPPNAWDLNVVIDQYTENSRMNSPGYGKLQSPVDFWSGRTYAPQRDELLKGKKSLHEAREAIYKEGEVRLAYATDSIGLYNYIRKTFFSKISTPAVVDITAFGDRLVAAAATGYTYFGIDPDPTLVDGISRLTIDIKAIVPAFRVSTYTLPLEHFTPEHEVDLVSFSPPPYTVEPYEGGERQAHKVYKSFEHWFYGFVREALFRAKSWLREGGILAFSVLDRETEPQIIYTEAMILFSMRIGFRPRKIFTLSSTAGTPWWIFQKDSSYSDDRFDQLYGHSLFPAEIKTNISPGIEFVRFLASKYLIKTCQEANIFENSKKTADTIGRILMSKVHHTNDMDPLFPTEMSEIILNVDDFSSNPNLPVIIQTADAGYRDQITVLESRSQKGVMKLFFEILSIIVNYLHWVQCTEEFASFERNVAFERDRNGTFALVIEKRYALSSISFIRKRSLFTSAELDKIRVTPTKVILWNSNQTGSSDDAGASILRYEAVGLTAHHFTRPASRIEALKKIARFSPTKEDSDVVDLFATPFNTNTSLYVSPYPDVDPGSLGNFFSYDGGNHRILMANPPPYAGFDEKMIDRLMNVYLSSPQFDGRIIFYSTTVWEDTGNPFLYQIRRQEDPHFEKYEDHIVLKTIWKHYQPYLRAVYILDHSLHPTFDPYTKKTIPVKTRATQSVGVILSLSKDEIDPSKMSLLSSGNHFLFD